MNGGAEVLTRLNFQDNTEAAVILNIFVIRYYYSYQSYNL